MKLLIALVEDGHAQDVRRQQVGRELNAFEARVNRARERFRQRCLARAGKILEQHMAATGERRQQFARRFRLALHDLGDVVRNSSVNVASCLEGNRCHLLLSCETIERGKSSGRTRPIGILGLSGLLIIGKCWHRHNVTANKFHRLDKAGQEVSHKHTHILRRTVGSTSRQTAASLSLRINGSNPNFKYSPIAAWRAVDVDR